MRLDAFRRHASNRPRYLRLQERSGPLETWGLTKVPSHELKQVRAEKFKNNKSSLLCRPSESQITQETDLIREVIEFARNKEMDRDSEMERRSFVVVMVNAGEQNLRDEWV